MEYYILQKVMTSKQAAKKTTPRALVAYPFPLQIHESLFFAVRGAFVDKVALSAGDMLLSVVKPQYDESLDRETDSAPEVHFSFFGDKPFHGALASKWNVKITVYSSDSKIPSLIFVPAERTITWNDVSGMILYDIVTAGSDAGEVTKTLVYTPDRGGFKRGSTVPPPPRPEQCEQEVEVHIPTDALPSCPEDLVQ